MKPGPYIIVEDDPEDREIIAEVLRALSVQNELLFFTNGKLALDYLYATKDHPFIIICDVNMPVMNGTELRSAIHKDPFLLQKSIPFIFYTTHANEEAVKAAYHMSVQGFFEKPQTIEGIKKVLAMVIDYWTVCQHPNKK